MHLLILLIQIALVTSNICIHETHKIKCIIDKYNTYRKVRCIPRLGMKIDNLAELFKAERFSDCEGSGNSAYVEHDQTYKPKCNFNPRLETSFGEYLYNISDYGIRASGNSSAVEHILDGLLVNENVLDSHWDEYKSIYKKQYISQDHENSALSVWKENLKKVAEHNQLYLAGQRSYTLHLNLFGDWPIMAYVNQLLKLIWTVPLFDPARDPYRTAYRRSLHHEIPKQMDWRTKGFRPRREEQWHCGACYAFAVAHALQAQMYKRHGDWRELSPQQIVDCSYSDGNLGCNGGSLQAALRYASRAGLIKEEYYPYRGKKGQCQYNSMAVSARPRRWATLPSGDEAAIERAVATIGPLAVAVNAEPFTFQLYRSGIYDDPFCVPWKLNHAMLLVGYTPEYWILLNWWGKQWGEDGYIRIRRGFNVCGVANMATYVEL